MVKALENRISELQAEKVKVDEAAAKTASPSREFDEMFELSMRFLANPYEIWGKGDLATKKTVLRLVFAHALTHSRNEGLRTSETTFPFKVLRFLSGTDWKMVPQEGLEPPTLSLRRTCSTS